VTDAKYNIIYTGPDDAAGAAVGASESSESDDEEVAADREAGPGAWFANFRFFSQLVLSIVQ
jgi:hypothetical protein